MGLMELVHEKKKIRDDLKVTDKSYIIEDMEKEMKKEAHY